jgi:hypothetical protein
MNFAYNLMRKASGNSGNHKDFNRYADMAMKAAVELIPYEAPRLNAITVLPTGTASKEEFERRQRLRVSIDIFNDSGQLIESAHQDDVNIRELPLLEQSRSS